MGGGGPVGWGGEGEGPGEREEGGCRFALASSSLAIPFARSFNERMKIQENRTRAVKSRISCTLCSTSL